MKEDFLQFVWANSLFKDKALKTVSGKDIKILDVGSLNRDAGPDFFNAHIQLDGIEWVGNVEIHCHNSDWNRHRHHENAAYDNVILSVVHDADMPVYNSKGREIETLELVFADDLYQKYVEMEGNTVKPGCRSMLDHVDPFLIQMILQSMAIERLERKCRRIQDILEQTHHDWGECFYRLICKYWTGNVNSEPLYQLSLLLPYKVLLHYSDKLNALEALLLGCSGLLDQAADDEYVCALKSEFKFLQHKHNLSTMEPSVWKFMRIRPITFPTIRLSLLAAFLQHIDTLLASILKASTVKEIFSLLDTETSPYWRTHYSFGESSALKKKKLGISMKRILLINAIVPFVFLYGKDQGEEYLCDKAIGWLESCPAENNYIVRAWNFKEGIDSALQSQALIEITKEYCEKQRCLKCKLSSEILKLSDI